MKCYAVVTDAAADAEILDDVAATDGSNQRPSTHTPLGVPMDPGDLLTKNK